MPDTTARRRALLAAALVLTLLGAGALVWGLAGERDPAPRSAEKTAESAGPRGEAGSRERRTGGSPSREEHAPALSSSRPERLRIPSLDVDSSLEGLGRDAKGVMETPRDPAKAGWYTPGTAPGARGPAVVAGHVTRNGKPAVFHRLAKLTKGQRIDVRRVDGRTAVFTVDRVNRYAKKRFPTVEVYRNLDHAGLRLITCGGTYDAAKRYYADNVVVFATLTGVRG